MTDVLKDAAEALWESGVLAMSGDQADRLAKALAACGLLSPQRKERSVNVIIYDAPESVDELHTAVYEGDLPVDVAIDAAARVGAAAELRRIADEAQGEGAFAVALGKLRQRADYLDPAPYANSTTDQGGQKQ